MKATFHPFFADDFLDAFDYHRIIDVGLAQALASEIKAALNRIEERPLACRCDETGCRRFLISRFRYTIHFAYEGSAEELFIIALTHTSRMPGFWLDRIK